jgi:SAM-dependent methyltransferase
MDMANYANSKIVQFIFRVVGAAMESRFRYRFFPPMKILQGADIYPGQTVLEAGCGTGFFTIPAAQLIGDQGCLVAMDVLPVSIEIVSQKVQTANLKNVRVVIGDAMNTKLESQSMDAILLFGVVPAPMVPLNRLLPEMHRVLKPEGTLVVWPPFSFWLPKAICQSGLFTFARKRNAVLNFRRILAT